MPRKPHDEPLQIVDASFRETPQSEIDLERDADQEEKAFLDEFQINDNVHDYYARIYRVVNGQQSFVEQVGPDKFPIEPRLQNLHKGGHFRAILFKNGTIWRNKTYRVEPPPSAEKSEAPSQISEIARLIAQQNEQIANMLQRGAPMTAPADPMAMFTGMIAALAQAKEFFAPAQNAGGANSLKDFMEMLAFAKELVADGQGGGRSAVDLAAEFLKSPIAGELAEQFKAQRAALPNPQTPQTPQTLIASNPPQRAPTPAAQMDALKNPAPEMPDILRSLDQATLDQLRAQVNFWIGRAQANSDPGLYADLLLDTAPPGMVEVILARPDVFDLLRFFNPAVDQFRPWFDAMLAFVMDAVEEPDALTNAGDLRQAAVHVSASEQAAAPVAPDGNSIGAGGDRSNVGNNVAAGKGRKIKPGNPG